MTFAAEELGLLITGRKRWKERTYTCPNCGAELTRAKWASHHCERKVS